MNEIDWIDNPLKNFVSAIRTQADGTTFQELYPFGDGEAQRQLSYTRAPVVASAVRWLVGEPAVCNLDGVAAVLACHADFWYLIGGLGHFLNVMYFPKYPILIAVIVRAPQGCEPGFLFHSHRPSLLYEDCCRTSVCANHPTVRKGCSLLLVSRGELIDPSRCPKPSLGNAQPFDGPGPIGAGLCRTSP